MFQSKPPDVVYEARIDAFLSLFSRKQMDHREIHGPSIVAFQTSIKIIEYSNGSNRKTVLLVPKVLFSLNARALKGSTGAPKRLQKIIFGQSGSRPSILVTWYSYRWLF